MAAPQSSNLAQRMRRVVQTAFVFGVVTLFTYDVRAAVLKVATPQGTLLGEFTGPTFRTSRA
jgi:hypothetical protein